MHASLRAETRVLHRMPLIGRLMRSGFRHLGFTPHTALSRTNRGSLPFARTTLSFPTAMPLCQHCRACSSDMLVRTTQRFAIPPSKACTTSGSDSVAFQLPMRQFRSNSQRSFPGHCVLRGNAERAPAATPSASSGSTPAMPGRPAVCAHLAATCWTHAVLLEKHQDWVDTMPCWHASTRARPAEFFSAPAMPWRLQRRIGSYCFEYFFQEFPGYAGRGGVLRKTSPALLACVRRAFGPPGLSFRLLFSLRGGVGVSRLRTPDQHMRSLRPGQKARNFLPQMKWVHVCLQRHPVWALVACLVQRDAVPGAAGVFADFVRCD